MCVCVCVCVCMCVCLTYILPWKAIYTMTSEKLRSSQSMLNQHTIIQQYINASGEIILENQTHACVHKHTHTNYIVKSRNENLFNISANTYISVTSWFK